MTKRPIWLQLIVMPATIPSRNLPPSTPLEKIDGWRRIKLLPPLSMKIDVTFQQHTYPTNVQCHKLGKMLSCRTEPKCWRPFSCTVKKLNAFHNRSSENQFCIRGGQNHNSNMKNKIFTQKWSMVAYLIFSSKLTIICLFFLFVSG